MSEKKRVNVRTGKAKLGQNFLADRRAAENIVDALGEISHAVVMEIGRITLSGTTLPKNLSFGLNGSPTRSAGRSVGASLTRRPPFGDRRRGDRQRNDVRWA